MAAARRSPNTHSAPTSFIGRAEELSELVGLLERARLVTLTGAPGIGKSRLGLELRDSHPDGGRVVELAALTRPADVPRAIAAALSVDEVAGQALTDTLVARLRRRRLLLVLDNCEHLLQASAKAVHALLDGCPDVRIVATSREPLGLAAETVFEVPPLPVPGPGEPLDPERMVTCAAVCLFVERACTVRPGFALSLYVAPAVARICQRLDGIPLAIELAAARVESLTPEEIARRLDDRFSLLTTAAPGAPARHRTLQAALDWSHDLLNDHEGILLRRLSVFLDGFGPEAAAAVCAREVDGGEVADLLIRLTDKSLVVQTADGPREARYRLLETIRAYGAQRVEQAHETASLRDAHARFYVALGEAAEPELTGPDQLEWLKRLDAERANLRSALEWSLSQGETEQALRLAGALVLFWRVRCHFHEGRNLLEAAVAAAADGAPTGLRAKALWGAGFMALMSGDTKSAIGALEESLAAFRGLRDRQGCARALLLLGNCMQLGDPTAALPLLEQSASEAREAGDAWCLAHALAVAGFSHDSREDLPAARRAFEECLEVAREADDLQSLRAGLLGLGSITTRQGDWRVAKSLLEEAVQVTADLGEDYSRARALQYLGRLAAGQGDYDRARRLLDEALALTRESGPPRELLHALTSRAGVARAEGDLSSARRLLDEALALANDAAGRSTPVLLGMGELALEEGDFETARRLLEEALELARGEGNAKTTAEALHPLGELARAEGDGKRAAALHDEALELRVEVGDRPGILASLEAMAAIDPAAGGYEHSARLLGAAQALREEHGYARLPWDRARFESDATLVREALGPSAAKAAFTEGAGLSFEQAIAEAFKRRGRRGRPDGGWSSLTQSEQQVAPLAAEGLTNTEIAERLHLSPWTVKDHLSHIFAKLGVAGRTQLAREVGRRGGSRPDTDR